MKIKLFGKDIFEFKGKGYIELAQSNIRESKYLPDFKKIISGNMFENSVQDFVFTQDTNGGTVAIPQQKKKTPKKKLTPKDVFDLKLLNDESFSINTNDKYVDEQIVNFKNKLKLIKSEEYDMQRGVEEIGSVLIRMENRKKYKEFKDFFDKFAYTTNTKIKALLDKQEYLKLGQVAQFIADMPNEAVDVIKEYEENVIKLCNKKPVFYIMADKKDFKKTDSRRDPILLAQSPFGHFWQILGAWDKEMLFLEEL